MVINQQLHAFQCGPLVNEVFLMFCLSYQASYMYRRASTTTLPYLNKSECNSIPVLVPPLDQQEMFAERVTTIETTRVIHRRSLADLDALFESIQHRAFRGEL